MGFLERKTSVEQKWNDFKHALSSKKAFVEYVQVEPFIDEDGKVNTWRNEGEKFSSQSIYFVMIDSRITDLSPTPPEKRSKSLSPK